MVILNPLRWTMMNHHTIINPKHIQMSSDILVFMTLAGKSLHQAAWKDGPTGKTAKLRAP